MKRNQQCNLKWGTNLELSTEDPPEVDVAGVRFYSLVVSQNLSCAGGWHGSQQQGVPYTSSEKERLH